MSVNPGFGGQMFIQSSPKEIQSLSKIRESRRLQVWIEWMAAFTMTRQHALCGQVRTSWSPAVPFSRRAMRGSAPGDSSNPLSARRTKQVKKSQLWLSAPNRLNFTGKKVNPSRLTSHSVSETFYSAGNTCSRFSVLDERKDAGLEGSQALSFGTKSLHW